MFLEMDIHKILRGIGCGCVLCYMIYLFQFDTYINSEELHLHSCSGASCPMPRSKRLASITSLGVHLAALLECKLLHLYSLICRHCLYMIRYREIMGNMIVLFLYCNHNLSLAL